jgi:prolyl-tRNA synthetase
MQTELSQIFLDGEKLRVEIDDRDVRGGEKSREGMKKGIPIRFETGLRDTQNGSICLYSRDKLPKEKNFILYLQFISSTAEVRAKISTIVVKRAQKDQEEKSEHIDSQGEFVNFL